MGLAAGLVAVGCAAVLIWAGLQKLLSRKDFAATLAMLGVPAQVRFAAALLVPVAELLVGAGLLLGPHPWAGAGVLLLGLTFAAAGALATRSSHTVNCRCFGAAAGGSELGWKQVALLPAWIAGAYVLYRWPAPWNAVDGMQYLAVLIVVLGLVQAIAVIPFWRSQAATRAAVAESIGNRVPILTRVDNAKG